MPPRTTRRPGRPALSQRVRILRAVGRGARTPKAAAKAARVPLRNTYTYLSMLRADGLLAGERGDLRLTRKGKTAAR